MRTAALSGVLALMILVLIGALVVADRRAADVFKAEPARIHYNARQASAAAAVARPTSTLIEQFASSQGTPESTVGSSPRPDTATVGSATDSSAGAGEPLHRKHHRRRWHRRR